MFKIPKEPMTEAEVLPTWEYLVTKERALKRNVRICRVIQPVGAVLFMFNLLLASMNFWLFYLGEHIGVYFHKMPILPSLIEAMPRESWSEVILFSILLAFVLPLAICALIAGVFYWIDWYRNRETEAPLHGTPAQRAQALTNKAENLYELRKKIPSWSIYLETGILTVLTAIPVAYMFIGYASDGAMALELAFVALLLLVCLFGLFWMYAVLFLLFSKVNSLLYLSPSQWTLYELYNRLDAYWESIDPVEFAKRQARAGLE